MFVNQRKKLGLFSLTSCGGCLLGLAGSTEIMSELANFYEINDLRSENKKEFGNLDLAIIEGNPDSKSEIELLRKIRRHTSTLLIVGACAQMGGVQSIRNRLPKKLLNKEKTRSVLDIVKVEYIVPGCPIIPSELTRAIMDIYWGKIFRLSDLSVCFECKQNGNDCLLHDNKPCLGPITRGGCDSICRNRNEACLGCRGLKPTANTKKMKEILEPIISGDEIENILTIYGNLNE